MRVKQLTKDKLTFLNLKKGDLFKYDPKNSWYYPGTYKFIKLVPKENGFTAEVEKTSRVL